MLHSFHHVRRGEVEHVARLCRRIAGCAVGVVLSGGGARGLAHLGVLKAMQEQRIPVDYVAGTNIHMRIFPFHACMRMHSQRACACCVLCKRQGMCANACLRVRLSRRAH